MPRNLKKSLQNYISKIKKQVPHLQISHSSISSTTRKIISGCKHPKNLSFAVDNKGRNDSHDQPHQRGEAATLEDIDNFLVENFKSLYSRDHDRDRDDGHNNKFNGLVLDEDRKKEKEKERLGPNEGESSGVLYDSPRFFTPPLDRYGSHLFSTSPVSFATPLQEMRLSGPGSPMTSNSSDEVGYVPQVSMVDTLTHGFDQHVTYNNSPILKGVEDCIAVLTASVSPLEDYKRSMKRVIDSRIENNQRVDWEFMEELLICHLRLNDKKQHRFILSAFVDLIVVLRQTLPMEN